jgi:hypothetical protein
MKRVPRMLLYLHLLERMVMAAIAYLEKETCSFNSGSLVITNHFGKF